MNGFTCERCGACCKWGGYVYITEDDVKRIAGHLSITEYEFVNRYAEIVHRPRLNLLAAKDGGCIFLEGASCAIYPARPKQCVDFPTAWRIKDLEAFCLGQKHANERTAERP